MKKRLQGLVAGLLIGLLLANGTMFTDALRKSADLIYNNIKIFIDGGEIIPKDVKGNKVEPFVIDGTTYLPIRAVANAFGQKVEWDGATQSIYIGSRDKNRPDNYLSNIQYVNLEKNEELGKFYNFSYQKISGIVTDYDGKDYTNGYLLNIGGVRGILELKPTCTIDFPLNSQYSTFTGNLVMPDIIKTKTVNIDAGNLKPERQCNVKILGDGRELFSLDNVSASMPISFNNLNVKGVNMLSLEFQDRTETYDVYNYVALTDLALYK